MKMQWFIHTCIPVHKKSNIQIKEKKICNDFHFQSTAVDAVVFRGLVARDPDSNVNGQVEYFIENETESPFKIDLPHQGIVRLAKPLDYETERIHFVTIVARVRIFTLNISY